MIDLLDKTAAAPGSALASRRKMIGLVVSPPQSPEVLDLRLFNWISEAFPVRFEIKSRMNSLDGVVYLGKPPRDEVVPSVPSLTFLGNEGNKSGSVSIGSDSAIHPVLRARSIDQKLSCQPEPVDLDESDVVLASFGGRPLWTMRQTASGRSDVTALRLPAIERDPSFFEYFNRENFINLLPLVEFVRRLTGEDQWVAPPLRACLMFDDPNLHALRYGFIDFPELARHAAQWNYHCSFATIPLDGWFSNRRTAQLFVEQKARLSLLMHGNDHVKNELAAFTSEAEATVSLAQAMRRVARIEETTHVGISRVMASPFGASSERTILLMARMGVEAACISSGSLRYHNSKRPWSSSLGLRMAEIIEGLPIFPRFPLTGETKNAVLLAAYMGQPIVQVGHHQDVAGGLDLLAQVAQFINSLGEIQWCNVESLARSNFLVRRQGDLLRVRPYSRRFQVAVPEGVHGILVEPPEGAFPAQTVKIATVSGTKPIFTGPPNSTVAINGNQALNVTLERNDAIDPYAVSNRGFKTWAVARRLITEGRDRLQPWWRRLAH